MTLPHFDPHGPHGFTTCALGGRIQHLPTYDVDVVVNVDFTYHHTLPHTGKHIYRTADGELFATARGSRRLVRMV